MWEDLYERLPHDKIRKNVYLQSCHVMRWDEMREDSLPKGVTSGGMWLDLLDRGLTDILWNIPFLSNLLKMDENVHRKSHRQGSVGLLEFFVNVG